MLLDSSCDSSHEEEAAAAEQRRMWCVFEGVVLFRSIALS